MQTYAFFSSFSRALLFLAIAASLLQAKSFGRVADADGYTNMRSQPTKKGEVVAWVHNGSCVELLGMENGWYKVQVVPGAETGFIYRRNLKVVDACPVTKNYTVPAACDLALDELFRLESVQDLVGWEKSRSACLDSEMQIAVSDFVMGKFNRDWNFQLRALANVETDSRFMTFFAARIRSSTDSLGLTFLLKSAENSCPVSAKSVCAILARSAAEGLKRR